jgi:protein O-mannosyl-transferase
MLARRYQLLFLFVIILAAYYPAVTAGFSAIDDLGMINAYRQGSGWNLLGLFIPSVGGGFYYRPLIGLSFLIDRQFFSLLPGMMHLENILLHFLNAVLVYFMTLQIIPREGRSDSLLPVTAAFLFGLHPVNAESVNWISGRTDVLAGTFVLLSALSLLKFREFREKKYLALSLCSFLGGVLSKEVALAFLPGVFLLMSAGHHADGSGTIQKKGADRGLLAKYAVYGLGFLAVLLIFYLLRSTAFTSSASRFGITLRAITNDWMHSMFVVLRAFGFYVKKLIMPYPLNLAILEVDSLYEIIAVPLAAFCMYCVGRGTLISALFSAGVFLIAPSFVLAFGQLAWTPYAERYMYITSAFFVIAGVVYLNSRVRLPRALLVKAAAVLVLVAMFAATLDRSMIWQNDLTLSKDTVEKSPQSRDMRALYGALLTKKGYYAEAMVQLEEGRLLPSIEYDERFDLNIAYIYYKQGRIDDAIRLDETALQYSGNISKSALISLIEMLKEKTTSVHTREERRSLNKKLLAYNMKLFELSHDPHILYNLGVTSTSLGEHKKAIAYFQQARDTMANDDQYRLLAQQKIKNLSRAGWVYDQDH